MVCMQPVLYQTGESFFWISLAQPGCLARPTRLGLNSVDNGTTLPYRILPWNRTKLKSLIWVLPLTVLILLHESHKNSVTKHCYNDSSMGFLHCTLLCQMCFKCGLLQFFSKLFWHLQTSQTHTQNNACTHSQRNRQRSQGLKSYSHSHHSLRKGILKVCFTKLKRGGRIFSFSPSSRRCVFEREWSSAGQVISLSQWEGTPWNSLREARKAAHNIPGVLLSKLCFIFCSYKPFLLKHSTCLNFFPSNLNVEMFGCFWSLFIHLFTDS